MLPTVGVAVWDVVLFVNRQIVTEQKLQSKQHGIAASHVEVLQGSVPAVTTSNKG